MLDSPNIKKLRLKEMAEVCSIIQEHSGVKPELITIGKEFGGEAMTFRIWTRNDLTTLVKALYLRHGIETVTVSSSYCGRRRGQTVQIERAEGYGDK